MNITRNLSVKIQARFEGSTESRQFFDVSDRIDSDSFEFTSSADGSTASAEIGLYTLFPISSKRWGEYGSGQEAIDDPMFRFEIPSRAEVQIYEGDNLIFGGVVMEVSEERVGGAIIQKISCADYTALLDERVIDRYRIPRDTYGWEMIKGGVSYEDGLQGLFRIATYADSPASTTVTFVSYDAETGVAKASASGHTFVTGEHFAYSGTEYKIVSTATDVIYYKRVSTSGATSIAGSIKIWSHIVDIISAKNHLYEVSQQFKFVNIAHFSSSFYVIRTVSDSRTFSTAHHVGLATGSTSSTFTNVNIVNVRKVSVAPKEETYAQFPHIKRALFETSVEHKIVGGSTIHFTAAQVTALSPWLDGLTESPASSGLYPLTVTVVSPYTLMSETSVASSAPVELASYEDGYPISAQAYTRSFFEAIRNNDPYSDDFDGLGIDYESSILAVENARYNPILFAAKGDHPLTLRDADEGVGTNARLWLDFSRKGAETETYTFQPTLTSSAAAYPHLYRIGNRSAEERVIGKQIEDVPVSHSAGTLTLTLDNNLSVGDKIAIMHITEPTAGAVPLQKYLPITSRTSSTISLDLTQESLGSMDSSDFPTLPGGSTCGILLAPTYNADDNSLKIYTDRPHSLSVNDSVEVKNVEQKNRGAEYLPLNFTVSAVSTSHDPAGGKFSSITVAADTDDTEWALQTPETESIKDTSHILANPGELRAQSSRYRPIHARRSTVSQVTIVTAEIIKDWAVKDADSWYAYLDQDADNFYAGNHVVRVLSLPYPFNGRWEVTEVVGNRITLARSGSTDIFASYARNTSSASWSGGYITFNFSSSHPFKVGQKIRSVNFAPSGYNVVDSEVYDVPSATSLRVAASNPGTNTDGHGTIIVEDILETTTITSIERSNLGTAKVPNWTTTIVAPNHNLQAGESVYVSLNTAPEAIEIEAGHAVVKTVVDGKTIRVASDAAGAVSVLTSPDIEGSIVRQLVPTSSTTALGLMISRVDDNIAENESFFINNMSNSNWDSSAPQRAGALIRREFLTNATASAPNSSVYWDADGTVTFYFNQQINNNTLEAFSEGRSFYADISCTSLTNDTEALSGIYTIFNVGTVTSGDIHLTRGITSGTKFIQYLGKTPATALVGLHTVDANSVLSADYLEYFNSAQTDTSPYGRPASKTTSTSSGGLTRSVTAVTYNGAGGYYEFTAANHGLRVGNLVYLRGTGITNAGLANFATASAKKKVTAVVNANTFRIAAPAASYKISKLAHPSAGGSVWTITLAQAAPQIAAYGTGAWGSGIKVSGVPSAATAPVKALAGATWSFASGVGSFSADLKTITLLYGPASSFTITNGAGANAKLSFANGTVSSLAASTVTRPGASTATVRTFKPADVRAALSDRTSNTFTELNYYNDLKIRRQNSPEIVRYYYASGAKSFTGTYTIASGVHTVTTSTDISIGSYQPNLVFTPNGGGDVSISGSRTAAVKSVSAKTLKFTSGSSTNTTAQACTITVRSAFTADSTHPTMPRMLLDGRIGARAAAYFPEDQWAVLRGEGFGFDGGDPSAGGGTTTLDQTWTFVIRPQTLPGSGHFGTLAQHGSILGAPYVSFGLNHSGNPWISVFTNSTTRTKYTATNFAIAAEDDVVLQYRINYTSATAATVYVSINTEPEQTLSIPTIYRGAWGGDLAVDGSTAGTLIVGAELDVAATYRSPYHGYIGEVVAFDRDIGLSDGLLLRAWMLHKWSLTQLIDDDLTPDLREARNIPNDELNESSQVTLAVLNGRTLKQAVEVIAKNANADFWVDKNKTLHYQDISTKNLVKNSILQDDRADASSKNWSLGTMTLASVDDVDATLMPGPYGYGYTIRYSGTAGATSHSDFITETESESSVAENQYYFVSAKHKSTDITKTNLRVYFYNSAANTVGAGYAISYEDSAAFRANDSWDTVWAIVKTPAGTAKMTIAPHADSSAASVTAHWTDFLCVRLTGSFGFADEGRDANGYTYLNHGETTGAGIPMPMYDFETPDNIRSSSAMANRLRLFTVFVNTGEGDSEVAQSSAGKEVLESVYDDIRGVWSSHGKIIEAAKTNDRAMTQIEITGTAQATLKEYGSAADSYTFEHQHNGQAGLLNPGDVVPFLWSEVGIYQPMIVKSQRSKLTGTQLYHTVTLSREPDYQKNALVLISRRKIIADMATVPESANQPPAPTALKVEALDIDGVLTTVDTDFRLSWDYAFDDPRARGVRDKGFQVQVRWRNRTAATTLKKANISTISFSTSDAGDPVKVTVKLKTGSAHGLSVGQIVKIAGVPFTATDKQQVNANGKFRVVETNPPTGAKTEFSFYVAPRKVTSPSGELQYEPITKVRTLKNTALPNLAINYTKSQGGKYSEWLNINELIKTTSLRWEPSSSSGIQTSTTAAQAITINTDLDFQFRVRAVGGVAKNIDVYSPYVNYPSGDQWVTLSTQITLGG